MVYIFVKLVWNRNPVYPMMRLVSTKNQEFSEMPLVIGDEFNIKIRQRKLCIGTEIAGLGWITCIANQNRLNKPYRKVGVQQERPLAPEYFQCLDCRSSSYFSCRQICIGKECNPSSQEAFDHCQGPRTSVYITHLGGQLKVGVSLDVQRRWLDQGSDYGVELIKLPGLEARRLEQQISNNLNLKLQIRNTAKIRDFSPINPDYAISEMEEKFAEIKQIINEDYQEIEKKIIDTQEIIDLTEFYGNLNPDRPIQLVEVKPTVEFGGTIESVKGSIIVVRNGIYLFGIDTKTLIGQTFDILDRSAAMSGQK
ncbi:MAG: DUF2797 domain-containing protein, partial [Candidatus Heimdallarchaeota archaeon]